MSRGRSYLLLSPLDPIEKVVKYVPVNYGIGYQRSLSKEQEVDRLFIALDALTDIIHELDQADVGRLCEDLDSPSSFT